MLTIDIDTDRNLLTLKPSGPLSESDFAKLAGQVDGYIDEHNMAPNMMIVADSFPYWDSLKAVGAHMRFVRDHHKQVQKVAVVGDGLVMSMMPTIGDLLVAANVKHFASDKAEKARDWATSPR